MKKTIFTAVVVCVAVVASAGEKAEKKEPCKSCDILKKEYIRVFEGKCSRLEKFRKFYTPTENADRIKELVSGLNKKLKELAEEHKKSHLY